MKLFTKVTATTFLICSALAAQDMVGRWAGVADTTDEQGTKRQERQTLEIKSEEGKLSGRMVNRSGTGGTPLQVQRGVPQAFLGGWETSYIYTYQSGPAIDFGNVILTGNIHDVPLPAGERSAGRWFNTSAFNRNNAEQLGSNIRTLTPRFNGIRTGAYNYWDVSLNKNVSVTERARMEFRAEALNVLNQVTFGPPNTTPTSTTFGASTAQGNVPRRLQLTLRLEF